MKNVSKFLEVGLPYLDTRTGSEVACEILPTGPHENTPANAATVVELAGAIVVRSISLTLIHGLT